MDDALCMGGVERVSNLDGKRQDHICLHRAIADLVFQGQSIHKLHDDERPTFVFTNLVNGADVRMVQSGSSTSFAAKAFQCLRVLGKVFWQEFHSDKAPKLPVLCLVNDPHATTAQVFDDAVMRNCLPNKLGGCVHWRES